MSLHSSRPAVELVRYAAWARVRRKAQTLIREEGCESRRGWIRAFERWQLVVKLFDDLDIPLDTMEIERGPLAMVMPDPLIPTRVHRTSYQMLVTDLNNLEGMKDPACATRICNELHEYARDVAISVARLESDLNTKGVDILHKLKIEKEHKPLRRWGGAGKGIETNNNTAIMYGLYYGSSKKVFKVNDITLSKLKKAYNRDNKETFLEDLFCLLVRYESLEGFGYQAAITDEVFDCLMKNFGVDTECFASPLNRYLPHYYSGNVDTDVYFGSSGSFFLPSVAPKEGSFEANPPFTHVFMVQMLLKIHELLRAATGPMSFALIVPAWQEEESWMELCSSPFLTSDGPIMIDQDKHCYLDGATYQRHNMRARPSPFGSGVFFLQNELGATKWPINEKTTKLLISAFSKAQPDADLKNRMDRDGPYVPKKVRNRKTLR
jgi:hypothetical protein